MSRPLLHSLSGFVRAMQISKTQLFLFMEGHENDPYFYSKICETVCGPKGISHEHRLAEEIPPGAGGKNALASLFMYMRRRGILINEFQGKRTAIVFFFDKDIDDLLRKLLRSPHVVYTRYYDVENHLFAAADLTESTAAAASFDRAVVARGIGNHDAWRARAAAIWKDWIKLCILARKRSIRGEYNYGVTSQVNAHSTGPIDPAALAQKLARLEAASGLTPEQFKRAYARVSRLVDDLFTAGNHDLVFKGKWYSLFLEDEMRRIAAGRRYNHHNLANRLVSGIAVTVNFAAPWADEFRQAVERVTDLL